MFSDLFWAIYWIDVLSGFMDHIFGGLTMSILIGVVYSIIRDSTSHGPNCSTKNILVGFFVSFVISVLLAFIPSKGTMYVMLGVKTTENIVQSPIGQKLQQLVNQEIDSYLNKLTKEK